MVEILRAGLHTSIQDFGRPGYRRYGIPPGGVMDAEAAALANRLVGNGRHAPLLECLLEGPSLKFHASAVVALTGADMQPALEGVAVPMCRTFQVEAGEVLTLGKAVYGRCTYLALGGGIRAQRDWGSCATYVPARLGGLAGKPLRKGDVLSLCPGMPFRLRVSRQKIYHRAGDRVEVPFVPGPEWHVLPEEVRMRFIGGDFSLSLQSNRAGFYFEEGIALQLPLPEILSSPVVPGCIQLTSMGTLILLMPDGPTVGGYHRIAVLSQKKLREVAQLPPGAKVRFFPARDMAQSM